MEISSILRKIQSVSNKITEIKEAIVKIENQKETDFARYQNPSLNECKEQTEGKKPDYVIINDKRFDIKKSYELLILFFDTVWEIDPNKFPILLECWENFFSTIYNVDNHLTKKLKCGLYTKNNTVLHETLYICLHTWCDIYGLPAKDFSIHYISE